MPPPNVVLGLAAQNAACDAVCALASVPGPGRVELLTVADALVVAIPLANPAFGPAVAGVAPALGLPLGPVPATAAGVVEKYRVYGQAAGGTPILEGTASDVGTPNMLLTNATVGLGDNVVISAWSHTQPAS